MWLSKGDDYMSTISSLSSLNLETPINSGSCSKIYKVDNLYFKFLNDDYRDLTEPENKEVLETLLELQQITEAPSLGIPIDIYCTSKELYGYTSKIMPGVPIDSLPPNTELSLIKASLKSIKRDIRKLANQGIKTEDIGGDNILFSDHMSIIDLDLSLVEKASSPDYLYARTMNQILKSTLHTLIGLNLDRDCISSSAKSLNIALKEGNSDEYEELFNLIIHNLEEQTCKNIKTVEEAKTSFQKVKSKPKM